MNVQNVLIIAEGPTDEHMLKPIITEMMKAVGKPYATVRFQPVSKRRGGIDQILRNPDRIQTIIRTNRMVDLFFVCVDRDGLNGQENQEDRPAQLQTLEQKIENTLRINQTLLGECAIEEIEVWIIAGHRWQTHFPNWQWNDIRQEPDPKEQYYQPFAQAHDVWHLAPGQGRKLLAQQATYSRIKQFCDEVKSLEIRVIQWLNQTD
ncbi:MAG: hypothetical protein GY805_16560 [Chloroflexi bacterium]|nr:hypothetical protein [Chloroflexota bacterium]